MPFLLFDGKLLIRWKSDKIYINFTFFSVDIHFDDKEIHEILLRLIHSNTSMEELRLSATFEGVSVIHARELCSSIIERKKITPGFLFQILDYSDFLNCVLRSMELAIKYQLG